jgi:hypothetical protein
MDVPIKFESGEVPHILDNLGSHANCGRRISSRFNQVIKKNPHYMKIYETVTR